MIKKSAAVTLIISILLLNCAGTINKKTHIILNVPNNIIEKNINKNKTAFPFNIKINPIDLKPLYDNSKIIERSGLYSIQFSNNGKWAQRPNTTATEILYNIIYKKFNFLSIDYNNMDLYPDFIINGTINTIELVNIDKKPYAKIDINLFIEKYSNKKIIFSQKYTKTKSIRSNNYEIFAKALSNMLFEIFKDFTDSFGTLMLQEKDKYDKQKKGQNL